MTEEQRDAKTNMSKVTQQKWRSHSSDLGGLTLEPVLSVSACVSVPLGRRNTDRLRRETKLMALDFIKKRKNGHIGITQKITTLKKNT